MTDHTWNARTAAHKPIMPPLHVIAQTALLNVAVATAAWFIVAAIMQ